MDYKAKNLCKYRFQDAIETLDTAKFCYERGKYKDSINRSYYAAFYSIKAVLALETVDFKRHKDAVGYFNKTYVVTGIFDKNIGRKLGRLKRKRESSDYDDFYIASVDEAKEQYEFAEEIVNSVKIYLEEKKVEI